MCAGDAHQIIKARRYSNLRYGLSIAETGLLLVFLFVVFFSGSAAHLCEFLRQLFGSDRNVLVAPALLVLLNLICSIVFFPLTFYHSFFLEHQFGLSRQSLGSWFLDQVKAGVLSLLLGCVCLVVWYLLMQAVPRWWWVFLAGCWIVFTVVLAKLAPVLLIPLFFKYAPCPRPELVARISRLAQKMHVPVLNVFEINYSAKSLKANAALTGWGNTRRVILTDTLRQQYSDDEIEVILAHEFAHQSFGHVSKHIALHSVLITGFLFIVSRGWPSIVSRAGLPALSAPEALPLALAALVCYGVCTQPLTNWASRYWERQADRRALEATGLYAAFVSMMEKLAGQNLSDRNPRAWIRFFFFDHPPVEERIAFARRCQGVLS